MGLVFSSVLLVEGLTRCPCQQHQLFFGCQKLAWQEWHSRTPHHVARPRPVLCMLNWQLKSLATTSPRPLIRDSPLPWSLYPLPAGNPIVCGILEDCSNCNRGSFISAGPGGGTPRSPSHLYRGSGWALSRTAGAVRCTIGSFWARQDWWAPSAEYRVIPGLSPPPGNYATQVLLKRSLLGQIRERLLLYWFWFGLLITDRPFRRCWKVNRYVLLGAGCDLPCVCVVVPLGKQAASRMLFDPI